MRSQDRDQCGTRSPTGDDGLLVESGCAVGAVLPCFGETTREARETLGRAAQRGGRLVRPSTKGVRSLDERVRESSASGSGERSGYSASEGSSDRTVVVARVVDRAAGGGDHRRVYVGHHGCGWHPRTGFDRSEFPTIGRGLWFALQTVTTSDMGMSPRSTPTGGSSERS